MERYRWLIGGSVKIPLANVREGQAFFLNYLEMRCEVFDASDGNGGAVLFNNAVFEEGASCGKGGKGTRG